MEEYNKEAWETLIQRCEEAGVDAFEVNFSCPHGMPERKMGMAMGQDCEILKVGRGSIPDQLFDFTLQIKQDLNTESLLSHLLVDLKNYLRTGSK